MYLEHSESTDEITFFINSPGGDVVSGLAIYDYINIMKKPVNTVCTGTAASMGAILFLAGKKRSMLPNTRVMIHDPSFSGGNLAGKKPHEIQRNLDKLNESRETLAKIIADKTGKSLDEIYAVTADDTYYNAEEAISFGLATEIYTENK
jgi:ATP-dependent Clp protease protease subunit